ncbi:MAG: flagellar hook-associated protein FlgK [Lachnospiraceae bacterium]|nr:flagellar hook-associated protein FlgK [Lachnospiraceae bacterium]
MGTSQFFGLMIGYSGLTAYQVAENTVANNVANVETEGYSRQYAERKASDALRTYTSYGMQGTGVTVKSIDQYRNEFLDNKYWANQSDVGRYETHEAHMIRIEKYFEDSSTVNGFSTIYDKFNAALEELAKNPGQTSTRTSFIGTAQTLSEYFRTMSSNLKAEQQSINEEIKTTVERINVIAEEIAALNKQINLIELRGSKANELRDKRAILVDELSKIVDVEVSEVPVLNEADKNNPTGANRYTVKISNGNTLVSNYDYNTLELIGRDENAKYNQSDVDGLYDIRWKETMSPFNVLADNLSGSLKSLIELRDGNNTENLKGQKSADYPNDGFVSFDETVIPNADPTKTINNTLTFKTSTIIADNLEEAISKLNIPEQGTINVGGTSYTYSNWKVSGAKNASTGAYELTFEFYNIYNDAGTYGLKSTPDTGARVQIGSSVDYQGIPYYQSQLNQWTRQFAYRFNEREKKGEDLLGDKMSLSFFQWKEKDGDLRSLYEYDFSTSTAASFSTIDYDPTSTAETNYYYLTAENFYVNNDIIKDPRLMSTTAKDGDVDTDASDVVDELIKIKDNKSVMEFRGCTSGEFLTCILSDISLNSMSAKTFKTNSNNIRASIQNQRDSVSSVDDDEEAMDLVKFQNAYNLNAKVIQTMTEIYDRLILQTGV